MHPFHSLPSCSNTHETHVLSTCQQKASNANSWSRSDHRWWIPIIHIKNMSVYVSVPWLLAEASASSAAISPGLGKPQRKITAKISKFLSQKYHETSWSNQFDKRRWYPQQQGGSTIGFYTNAFCCWGKTHHVTSSHQGIRFFLLAWVREHSKGGNGPLLSKDAPSGRYNSWQRLAVWMLKKWWLDPLRKKIQWHESIYRYQSPSHMVKIIWWFGLMWFDLTSHQTKLQTIIFNGTTSSTPCPPYLKQLPMHRPWSLRLP